jgi:hypothetical protein
MRSFSPGISPRSIKCFASLAAVCLAAAGAVSAVPAAAPAPSGTPCTYSCPAADEAGFELGRSSKPNASTLRCDYPGTPGETGLYFCNYTSAVRSPMLLYELRLMRGADGRAQVGQGRGLLPAHGLRDLQRHPPRHRGRLRGLPAPDRQARRSPRARSAPAVHECACLTRPAQAPQSPRAVERHWTRGTLPLIYPFPCPLCYCRFCPTFLRA